RQRGLVVEDKATRVARFQHQTLMGLREMLVAMGLNSPWELKPHHVSERLNSVRSDSIDRFYHFLEEGQLADTPDDTQYARYWEAAQANSFKAAV
ncbi:MAG: FMN-binding glutamate synthase family protein, partial [Croceibacterium sp.]